MDSQVIEKTSPESFIPHPPKYKRVSSSSSIVSKTRRPVSGNSVKFKTENGEILKPNYTSEDTDVYEKSIQRNNVDQHQSDASKYHEDEKGNLDKTKSGTLNSDIDESSHGDGFESGKSSKCSNFEDSISVNTIDKHSGKENPIGLQFRNFRRPTVTSDQISNKAVEIVDNLQKTDSTKTTNGELIHCTNKNISKEKANTDNSSDVKTEENQSAVLVDEAIVSICTRGNDKGSNEPEEARKISIEGEDRDNEIIESKEHESNDYEISRLQHTVEDQNISNKLDTSSPDSKVNITSNKQLMERIDMHNNSDNSKYPTGNKKASTGNENAKFDTQVSRNSTFKHQSNDHDAIEVIENEPSTSASDTAGPNPVEVAIWMKRRAMMRRRKKRRIYTTDVYETDGQMSNQGYMEKPQGEAAEKRKVRNQILKRRLSLATADIGDGTEMTQTQVKNESDCTTAEKVSEEILDTTTSEKNEVDGDSENQRLIENECKGDNSEGNEVLGNNDTIVSSETDVRESGKTGENDMGSSLLDSQNNGKTGGQISNNEYMEKDDTLSTIQTADNVKNNETIENQMQQEERSHGSDADAEVVGNEKFTQDVTDTSADELSRDEVQKKESTENEGSPEEESKENEDSIQENVEKSETKSMMSVSDKTADSKEFENGQVMEVEKTNGHDRSKVIGSYTKEIHTREEHRDDVKDIEENAHTVYDADKIDNSETVGKESESNQNETEGESHKYSKSVQKRQNLPKRQKENNAKSKCATRLDMSSSEMDSLLADTRRDKLKPKKKNVRHKSKKQSPQEDMASSSEVESHEELSNYKQRSLKDLCKELKLVRRAISELYDESKKRKKKENRRIDASNSKNVVEENKRDEETNPKEQDNMDSTCTYAKDEKKNNRENIQNESASSDKNVAPDEMTINENESENIIADDNVDGESKIESKEDNEIEESKENDEAVKDDELPEKSEGRESAPHINKDENYPSSKSSGNRSSTEEDKEVIDTNKNDASLDAKGMTQDEKSDLSNSDAIEEESTEIKAITITSTELQIENTEIPSTQDVKVEEENEDDFQSLEEKDDREDDCSLHVSRCESVNLQVEGRHGTRVNESDMDSVMWRDDDFPELRSSTSDETISIVKDIVDDLVKRVCDFPDNRTHKKELRMKKDNQDEIFCIVYCDIRIPGFTDFAESLSCKEEDLMAYSNMVPKYGNLLSPVITLVSSSDSSVPEMFTVRVPFMKASMRHYQTPVLRLLTLENAWEDIRSEEYMYEDDDGCIIPVLEAEMNTLAPMAVVAMPIIETFIFDGNVREMCSCVDPGIVISSSFSPRFNSVETIVNLTVLPISTDVIDDSRYSRAEDSQLLAATSSLIKVDLLNDPPQAVTLYLPCDKPKSRPWTAQMSSRLSTDSGFVSRIKSRAKSREAINNFLELWYEAAIYLVRIANGNLVAKETRLKNRDVTRDEKVVLTCHEKTSTFLIVETKKEAQHPNVNSIANNLLYYIETQRVVLCILQKKENVRNVTILCDLKSRLTSRMQLRYEREHYIKRAVFSIKEGDLVKLSLRGNIANIKKEVYVSRFYAIHGLRVEWEINVVDIYSQRSLPSFCGFLQVHTWNPDESMTSDTEVTNDDTDCWSRVIDVPITLPKYKSTISASIIKVPLHLRNEGPISVDFLMSLAKYIGYEWYHLARALHIDHARVQSIVQQNRHQVTQKLVSDLLLTWMKRSPHGVDKAHVLVKALRRCGRSDLADEIKDIDKTYKRDLHKISYEKRLSKAIETTASSPIVVQQWRRLSNVLGVRERTIASISSTGYDDKRKCMAMLAEWRKSSRHRSHRKLVGSLRQIGCNCVADHLVSSIVLRPKTSL